MQKIITIPGYGEVEFPDTMSEDDVNKAAAKLYKDGGHYKVSASQDPQFAGVHEASGSSTTAQPPWYSRLFSGMKEGAAALASPITHPIDTATGLVGETLGMATRPGETIKRFQDAYTEAQGPEHQGAGLDPLLHGAVAAAPLVGQFANKLLAKSNTDLAGAVGEAGTMIAGGELASMGLNRLLKGKTPEMGVQPPHEVPLSPAESLLKRSAVNQARALQPKIAEHKAITEVIAPELAQRSVGKGLTGKAYDADVIARLRESEKRLRIAEDEIMVRNNDPEFQTPRQALTAPIDAAIGKLKVPRTGVSGHPEAVAELESLRREIMQLPEEIAPDQLIKYNRQLDQRAMEMGGFKEAGTSAEKIRVKAVTGVANIVRAAKNELPAPDFVQANKDYSLYRNAADVVEYRNLGTIGKNVGDVGRGGILDDLAAGWLGNAIGGKVGAVGMEAINLIRQGRGVRGAISRGQATLAQKFFPPTGLEARMEFAKNLRRVPKTEKGGGPAPLVKSLSKGAPVPKMEKFEPLKRDPITGQFIEQYRKD